MRQFKHAYDRNPSKLLFRKLIKANETNAANLAISEHCAKGLVEAIQIEKKKRKRGKRLGLIGKETTAGQWFGPAEIQEARELRDKKERDIIEAKVAKEDAKKQAEIDKAVKKALEDKEKEDRAV
ncbi:hypothetical protein BKA61DRAFT_585041 [Leptodontidium sp. MPI-SDFR-AT-0119]|nr:hypothetical protein BKA61DRAFT_585041 [Leptodontidium sp. MPI-SDFR-AT-0119]